LSARFLGKDWRPDLGKREGVLVFIGDAVKMLPFGELAISETLSVRKLEKTHKHKRLQDLVVRGPSDRRLAIEAIYSQ
jgi:hypothetical protein